MKGLVTNYCCVVFVAFKATELNKACFDCFIIFLQEFNRQNPLRASGKMKGKWLLSPSY